MTFPTIHWPYLALALVLLWFPRQWLRLGPRLVRIRRRSRDPVERFAAAPRTDPSDKAVVLKLELLNRRNYVDFFRAFVGAFALPHFAIGPAATPSPNEAFCVQVAVLLAGVVIQTVRPGENAKLFAPLFYLFGVGLVAAGPYEGLFGMLSIGALHLLMPNPRFFLGFYGLFVAGYAVLLASGDSWLTGAFVMLAWTPPLLSVLANRSLITYSHKVRL